MLDHLHLGDRIGQFDQRLGRVAPGHHHVLHRRSGLQVVQYPVDIQITVAQGDVQLIEQYQRDIGILKQLAGLVPGGFGGGDIALPVLGVPGIALAHDVERHSGLAAIEGLLPGGKGALDELHHAHLHVVAQRPGQHAEAG